MSLDNIIEHINKEAKKEADRIRKEAKDKADQILRESSDEARLKKEAIQQDAKKTAQERERRMMQMAHLSGRKKILAEKQKAIQTFFDTAIDQLIELDRDSYKKMLKVMVLKAVRSGREEIIISSRDKKILNEDWLHNVNKALMKDRGLPGKLRLSQDVRPIKGGFILRDGQIETNSSFEAILKYNENELKTEVAELMLGE